MSIKSIFLSAVAAACLGPSAMALSCKPSDITLTMEQAKASDDLYYVLVGTFQSTPLPRTKPKSPNEPMNGIGAHTVQAWFDGRILSNNPRNDAPVTQMPIDVAVSCVGPWCGSAPSNGQEVIAFVKARPGQPMLLEAGACPDKVFSNEPAMRQVEKLRPCFDRSCNPGVEPFNYPF